VRQPLGRIILPIKDEEERDAVNSVKAIILDETNLKAIEFVDDDSGIVEKSAKPNFPRLGKRLGKHMKTVAAHINKMSSDEINEYEKTGSVKINLDDESILLEGEDIDIIRHGLQGWSVESENGLALALDTTISKELKDEGLAREFVNRVQNMRKDADYEVTDRILIGFQAQPELIEAISGMADYVMKETLAKELKPDIANQEEIREWEIGDFHCTIGIERVLTNSN
jgi:isoleucyl-tRNA synthetase